jgi:hypothetical protein
MAYQTIPPGVGIDRWQATQQNFLKSLLPQLTRFEYLKIGPTAYGTTAATSMTGDAAKEGGAESAITTGVIRTFTNGIFQTLKTGKWALTWRGTIAAPVSAKSMGTGLINTALSHDLYITSTFATDATKWVLRFDGAGATNTVGTIAADGNPHTFSLTGNATTVSAYVDNVLMAATTTLTNVVDESVCMFTIATTLTDSTISRAMWGFVDP